MEELLKGLGFLLIIFLILLLIIYIVQAVFLNKFNKLVYGKGTVMAWLPIFNVYLLGKLTFNKLIGWILVICSFLTTKVTTTINGVVTNSSTILPENIIPIFQIIYSIVLIVLFIYAIIKYFKLKKTK